MDETVLSISALYIYHPLTIDQTHPSNAPEIHLQMNLLIRGAFFALLLECTMSTDANLEEGGNPVHQDLDSTTRLDSTRLTPLHNRNLSAGYECDEAVGIYSPQVIQSMIEAWVSLLKNHAGSEESATAIEEFLPQVEYHVEVRKVS